MPEVNKLLYNRAGYNNITRDLFPAGKTDKDTKRYLISRPNPISVILRRDVPLTRKMSLGDFYKET